MKTNHKETHSSGSTLTPLLRYVNTRSLAIVMFVALAILGTTRGNEMEKTAPAKSQAKTEELSQGSLEVYSATDEFKDGDARYFPHSSYAIYTTDGKLLKSVGNHISRTDEIPEIVALPVGSYTVVARAEKYGSVRVPVAIKKGQRTILDLDLWETKTQRSLAHN
jgi:hypothetical protein